MRKTVSKQKRSKSNEITFGTFLLIYIKRCLLFFGCEHGVPSGQHGWFLF